MCGCSSATETTALLPAPCDDPSAPGLERTRFFPRMLVGPEDLTQDQIYFREKLRRHNRMLHGWGVVCGLNVTGTTQKPCEVVVHAGYALGPWGDEISVPDEVTIDVCKLGSGEILGCPPEGYDPWCSDMRASCKPGRRYLAVRYAECRTLPVRSGGCGCGCDESACEYSRIRDGYAFTLLDELPDEYKQAPQHALQWDPCTQQGAVRPCIECPKAPWVILAALEVNAECKLSGPIDCFTYRRYVVSWAGSPIFCV